VKALWGLALGVACAIAIACGGAKKSAMSPAEAPPPTVNTGGMGESGHQEIDRLDKEIATQLEQMKLAPPAVAPMADPQAMSVDTATAAANAKTCTHGQSEICRSACELSDSICTNAGKICNLAAQLANDSWANQKCANGKASCDAASGRCCSCQP